MYYFHKKSVFNFTELALIKADDVSFLKDGSGGCSIYMLYGLINP